MSREAIMSAEISAVYQPAITGIQAVQKALDHLTKTPTDVHIRVPDINKVQAQIDKVVQMGRTLQRTSAAINVQANTTEAKRKITELQTVLSKVQKRHELTIAAKFDLKSSNNELDALLKRARSIRGSSSALTIQVSSAEARQRVQSFTRLLTTIPRRVDVLLNVAGGTSNRDLTAVVSGIRELKRTNGKITISVDVSNAQARLNSLKSTLQGLSRTPRIVVNVSVSANSGRQIAQLLRDLQRIQRTAGAIVIRFQMPPGLLAQLGQAAAAFDAAARNAARLQSILNGLGPGARGVLSAFAGWTGIAGVVQGIVGALGGLAILRTVEQGFRAAATAAFDFNKTIETAKIGFTTMLDGNEKAADQFLADLKKFSLETPFEFKELVPLSQKIKAFGFDLKDVLPILRAVGSQVSAFGGGTEVMDRIIYALGQIRSLGKLQGQEIRQLANANVKVNDYIAAATGKTVTETAELIKTGAIDGEQAVTAIINGMERKFGGMMPRMMMTMGGGFSNLKDALTIFVGEGLEPVYKALTRIVVKAAWFANNKEVQRWAKETAKWFIDGFTFAGEAVQWFWGVIKTVTPLVIGALTAIGVRSLWLGRTAIGSAIGAGITSAISALRAWIAAMAAAGGAQVLLAGIVGVAVAALATNTGGVRDKVVDAWKSTVAWIAEQYDAVTSWLNRTFHTNFEGGFAAAVKVTMPDVDTYFAGVKKVHLDALRQMAGEISGAVGGLFPEMPDWGKLNSEANAYIDSAKKAANTKPPQYHFDGGDGGAGESEKRAALRMLSDALGDASKAWRDYGKAVEDAANKQLAKLKETRDSVVSFVQTLESRLLGAGGAGMSRFYAMVGALQKGFGDSALLGQIARNAGNKAQAAEGMARGYESVKEQISGQDGVVPGGSGAGGYVATDVAVSTMDALAQSIKTARGQASCANFAGALLNGIGAKVPRDARAGVLAANALKLAPRIGIDKAGAADLVVYHGPRYGELKDANGWGYHVGVGAGNGKMWDSSGNGAGHQRFGKIPPLRGGGEVFAVDTSALIKVVQAAKAASTAPDVMPASTAGKKGGAPIFPTPAAPNGAGPTSKPDAAASDATRQAIQLPPAKDFARLIEIAREKAGATWTKYSESSIEQLLKLQPRQKEGLNGNASRREALEFLARENAGISVWAQTQARAKGLAGEAAKKFAATQAASYRAAIYALANLTDAEVNADNANTAAIDAAKARQKSIDEVTESGKRRVELAKVENSLLNSRVGEDERADRLRIEETRLERISELLRDQDKLLPRDRLSQGQAEFIADAEAKAATEAAAQERVNKTIIETRERRQEAAQAAQDGAREAVQALRTETREQARALDAVKAEIAFRRANPDATDNQVDAKMAARNAFQAKFIELLKATAPVLGLNQALMLATIGGQAAANQAKQNAELGQQLSLLKDIASIRKETATLTEDAALESRLLGMGADKGAIDAAKRVAARKRELEQLRKDAANDPTLGERERLLKDRWKAEDSIENATTNADSASNRRDYLRDLGDRVRETARAFRGGRETIAEQIDAIREKLTRQNWSSADIEAIIPQTEAVLKAEQAARQITDVMSGCRDAFGGIVEGIEKDGLSHFGKMFDGIYNRFQAWGSSMIQDAIWSQVSGLLGNLLGGAFGGASVLNPAISAAPSGGIAAGLKAGGRGLFGGGFHALGLERVPYNNYPAILHMGERVVAARDVENFESDRRRAAALSQLDGGSSGRTSLTSGGGSSGGAPIIVHGDLHVNEAKKPRETAREIAKTARSRSESQRRLQEEGSGYDY